MIDKRLLKRIRNLALRCIKIEALSYPSLGLVSSKNPGCHLDMDIGCLLKSQKTFKLYFQELENLVFTQENLDFQALRQLGKKQESRMFKATSNINTHKGLIFAFGIIYSITIYGLFKNISFSHWQFLIQNLVQPLKLDFVAIENSTKGIEIFKKFQLLGARGTALSGYEVVFKKGLLFLNYYQHKYYIVDLEKKCLLLLIFYLSKIHDTTLINKIGFSNSEAVRKQAQQWLRILSLESWNAFYKTVLKYNYVCCKNNISPGGCADLVIITLFLSYFQE